MLLWAPRCRPSLYVLHLVPMTHHFTFLPVSKLKRLFTVKSSAKAVDRL